jgi:hypothetical protein
VRIRTVYFKVSDLAKAGEFWASLLKMTPVKKLPKYYEWRIESLNLGLVLNDFGDKFSGCNCVPVFEFPDAELASWIERAQSLGATLILDGLADTALLSVVMADPWGNEFELSKFHN